MNDRFLRACRREPVDRTPIWIMRQAGRYLPEYREIRRQVDFSTLCHTPELAARVTLQPLERFDLDAAILFSDILVLAEAMGFRVDFQPGPVLEQPVENAEQIARLPTPDPEEAVPYVYETVRILSRELRDRVPLIGFAAAPFTLAAYLVEGKGSKNFDRFKELLYGDPAAAHRLLDKIGLMTERYLQAQVRAGAQAVQLFDSWAGLLGPDDYREFALRHARRVLDSLAGTVPRIYFALGATHLLEEIRECGADVVGLDWRCGLDEASSRLGDRFVLQGNLDPCVLLSGIPAIEERTGKILEQATRVPGHVFNLGHGILPRTPIEHVEALIAAVHGKR